jgi:hypothetical protein
METPKSEGYLSTIRQQMETLSWLNGLLNADALIAQRTSRADERDQATVFYGHRPRLSPFPAIPSLSRCSAACSAASAAYLLSPSFVRSFRSLNMAAMD